MSTKKSSPQSDKSTGKSTPAKKHVLSHHASVLEHDPTVSLSERIDTSVFLPEDVHLLTLRDGGIDEIRAIHTRVYLRPRGKHAAFLITSESDLTAQAQNALLKVLEDPPLYAHIVLSVPTPRTLLETVRSRVHFLSDDVEHRAYDFPDAHTVLDASLPQRLLLVEPLIERKNIEEICAFIEKVHRYITDVYASNSSILTDQTKSATTTIDYVRMNGAMVKMLVEAWVLTLPVKA